MEKIIRAAHIMGLGYLHPSNATAVSHGHADLQPFAAVTYRYLPKKLNDPHDFNAIRTLANQVTELIESNPLGHAPQDPYRVRQANKQIIFDHVINAFDPQDNAPRTHIHTDNQNNKLVFTIRPEEGTITIAQLFKDSHTAEENAKRIAQALGRRIITKPQYRAHSSLFDIGTPRQTQPMERKPIGRKRPRPRS